MAIAGKVAITLSTENGGAWSADVTYDRLVAVKHNNNLYISRKTVANVEPPNDEFWFLTLEGFGGDDVQVLIDQINGLEDAIHDIIDGTTQVGNAKTIDGHGAEYFASTEAVKNNALWHELTSGFDLNNALGKYNSMRNAIVSTLLNKPDGVSGEITVEWYPVFSDNQYGLQILRHTSKGLAEVYFRSRYNITWSEWQKVFSTVDDTMKAGANLYEKFESKSSEARWYGVKNNDNTVFGAFGAYAESGIGKFMFIGANGTESFKAAQGLTIYPDKIQWKMKELLHTGNKPTGSYTGNGSATTRTINIGGVGNMLFVRRAGSGAVVYPFGATTLTDSGNASTTLKKTEACFENGVLTLNTSNSIMNDSGVTYTYEVK